jgi:predicted thioesterase
MNGGDCMATENTNDKASIQRKEALHNKYDEAIKKFTLMSDTFMSVVFKDKVCAELLLRIILKMKVAVKEIRTQYDMPNYNGRSARLDIWAETTEGKKINVEVQNANEGAIPERARFNSSIIDTTELEKSAEWSDLPETYVILITRDDVLGGNKPIYHIDRRIEELDNKLFGDRSHIIYVNSKIQDDTELGRLMHDMNCQDAKDMYYKELSDKVDYYKNNERGDNGMCEIMDELIEKEIKDTKVKDIKSLMSKLNLGVEKAMECLSIPKEDYPIYLKLLSQE